MLNEFKKFIVRGNVIDLAVGVIIGGAFSNIVNSVVNDLFMPILSLLTDQISFENFFIALDGKSYASASAALANNVSIINFGSFIASMINFLLMAIVVFLIVKAINTIKDRIPTSAAEEVEEAPSNLKECPFCKSSINILATRCPNCTSILENDHLKA